MNVLDLSIEEYTSPIEFTLAPDESIDDALKRVSQVDYRHYPVIGEHGIVGIVSQRDLEMYKDKCVSRDLFIKDIMKNDVLCVPKGASMEETVYKMAERKVGSAIVIAQGDKPYGIFTSIDVMNALIEIIRGEN